MTFGPAVPLRIADEFQLLKILWEQKMIDPGTSRLPQERRQGLHNIGTEAKTRNHAGEIGEEIILRRDDGLQNVLRPSMLAVSRLSA